MKYKLFAVALLLSLGFDQGSKIWARHELKPRYPETISVIAGYWDFRYAENTGAAFSFMRDSPSAAYLFAVMVAGGRWWRSATTSSGAARGRAATARSRARPGACRRLRSAI